MLSPGHPDVRSFLRRSMIAEVATLSAKGRPFMTPLWFVLDGGALYITTGPESWAGKNVMRHPDVALLFRAEPTGHSDRVLRLHGTATCHRGLPRWRVLLRIAAKYYASPAALRVELPNARKWRLRQLYYGQLKGGFGYIRVVPTAAELLARP